MAKLVISGIMGTKLLFLVSLFPLGPTEGSEWPYWRGPNRDGVVEESDLPDNWATRQPGVAWQANLGWGFSAVAVSDGKVLALGNLENHDVLYCLAADTGELHRRQSHPEPRTPRQYEGGPNASPVVHDGIVYTLSKTGKIFARQIGDGSLVWSLDLVERYGIRLPTWGLSGSALIIEHLAIFNVGSHGMAFDRLTGKEAWSHDTQAAGYATPVAFDWRGETRLAMFGARELIVMDPYSGRQIMRFPWPTRHGVNAADPIIEGDKIFISSGYNQGCALLAMEEEKLTTVWQNRNMRNQMNSSVLWQGHIYGFDESQLRCLELATGEVKWSQRGLGKASLIIVEEKLVILTENGRLVLAEASPEGYRQLMEKPILSGRCWTMPVMADGRIYVRNAAGQLVCLNW